MDKLLDTDWGAMMALMRADYLDLRKAFYWVESWVVWMVVSLEQLLADGLVLLEVLTLVNDSASMWDDWKVVSKVATKAYS